MRKPPKQAPFYVKVKPEHDVNKKSMYLVVSHTLYDYTLTHPELDKKFKAYKANCFTDMDCRMKTRDARAEVGIDTKREFTI